MFPEKILGSIGVLGAAIIFAIAWYRLFQWADKFVSDGSKKALTQRLVKNPTGSWVDSLTDVFDRVFVGIKPSKFNRPKFWRSSITSLSCVVVLSISFILSSSSFRASIEQTIGEDGVIFVIYPILLIFAFCNLVPDYISVLQTRLILKWMRLSKSIVRKIILVFLDFVITGILALCFYSYLVFQIIETAKFIFDSATCELLPDLCFPPEATTLEEVFSVLRDGLMLRGGGTYYGIHIYTTFFTSMWIWFFAASELILRNLPVYFRNKFFSEEQPFRSLGIVFSVLVGFFYFIVVGLFEQF